MRTCTVTNNRAFARPIVFTIAQHAQVHALVRCERYALDDGCRQSAQEQQHECHEEDDGQRSGRAQHIGGGLNECGGVGRDECAATATGSQPD